MKAISPLVVAYVAAAQSLYTTPVLLGAVSDSLGLRADQVGLMITIELLAFAAAGLLLAPRLDRLPRGRIVILAALGVGIANVASGAIDTLGALTVARAFAGISLGCLLATTSAEIAHFADAEARYARCMMVALAFGCVGIFIIPEAARRFGHAGSYGYIAAVVVLLVPFMRGWPPQPPPQDAQRGDLRSLYPLFAFVVLLFFSDGLVYPFAERIGRALDMDRALDLILALSLGVGLFGALAAERLGGRFGNVRPLLVGAWGTALSGLAVVCATGPVSFALGASAKNLTMFFLFPFLLGAAAVRDPSGRGAAAVTGVVPLGIAIGPFVGGMLVERWGFPVLGWVGVALVAVATPFAVRLLRPTR